MPVYKRPEFWALLCQLQDFRKFMEIVGMRAGGSRKPSPSTLRCTRLPSLWRPDMVHMEWVLGYHLAAPQILQKDTDYALHFL